MRARTLLVGMGVALAVTLLGGPAWAKGVVEANISGPGLGGGSGAVGGGGGMRIDPPESDRMWESGIMEDTKADSVSELGVPFADLGPKYVVTYRFDFGPGAEQAVARQDLYPYAKGGPVTFTPAGQLLSAELFDSPLPSGWVQAEPGFLEFLVENGLPETNPVAAAAPGQPTTDPDPLTRSAPWPWIVIALAGLAGLVLVPTVRRRVLVAIRG